MTVHVLHEMVAERVVEVLRRVVGQQRTLLSHRRPDDESERGERGDQLGEDDRHRRRPSRPAPAQCLDQRIEGTGQKERDHQQGDDLCQLAARLAQAAGNENTECCDKPDKER